MSGQTSLPIDALMPRLLEALMERGAVVLQAAPGAGKTTRVPAALLGTPAIRGKILVLEPRRIAARAAATRVASELGDTVGGLVGYQVRLDSKTSARTRIVFMTEGVLTRQLLRDPLLEGVGAVILDEVHERHLHTDIALALVTHLRRTRRPDLRIVVMSATLDAAPVAALLDAVSLVCDVPAHPVELAYAPSREPVETQVAIAVRKALRDEPTGHVLVFLPGTSDIRKAILRSQPLAAEEGVRLLPLHGSLSPSEQDAVLAPSKTRKVIVSTNVAESSLTIDGVRTVIDSGLVKVAHQPPGSTVQSLKVERVSRASAIQRAGRAGRTAPGRCIRLYSEFDFQTRPEFDVPEILRSDLSDLVLTVLVAGAQADTLPWLSPLPADALAAASQLLLRIGAARDGKLSPLGRRMAALPVHPRIARCLLEAERHGLGESGAALAALLVEEATGDRNGSQNFWDQLARFEEFLVSGGRGRGHEGAELQRGSLHSAARAYRELVRHVDARPLANPTLEPEHALSLALLAGFPDRVARRNAKQNSSGTRGPGERTLMLTVCDGSAATVRDPSAIGGDGCTLLLDARDGGGTGSIHVGSAIPLRADWILDSQGDFVEAESQVLLNRETGRVESIDRLRYGRLVLDESRSSAAGSDAAIRLLTEEYFARGLDRKDALDGLQRRARYAKTAGFAGIEEELRITVANAAASVQSLDELAAIDVAALFTAEHASLISTLGRVAPAAVRLPTARDLPIVYPADGAPFVESYLQDFFGISVSPVIAGVPLVMHLWAPNRRPVQVTSDLASFWKTTYPELRRALMRRYPKHHWPEDPTDAKATRFARNA